MTVYSSLSMFTTWIGRTCAQMFVKPSTSEKKIVTSGNSSGMTFRPAFSFSATFLGTMACSNASFNLRSISSRLRIIRSFFSFSAVSPAVLSAAYVYVCFFHGVDAEWVGFMGRKARSKRVTQKHLWINCTL